MSVSTIGLLTGILLALAAILGGFWGFVLAAVLGGVGWVVGAQIEGRIDLGAAFRSRRHV
ncbi:MULTISPECIES: DUF2273 domain-containing protein [Oerskovia]|uniref:DUF2273 domain-containing protein n=2 Tax=Oerskovia TaxID=162491 RepID=A0ABR8UXT3_9CELL|nr:MULTISPECIES: DUF2273 domain-containing protein [Oerskovia]MBD7997358.1 DUF2273 domain-containing protein [Oerskovia gallyi]MBM7497692.1 putative membrane protein [Oerskovia paurometabola]